MVFSNSIPPYQDQANWHQTNIDRPRDSTSNTQHGNSSHNNEAGSCSNIRPGSMADQARMANIAIPEAGLECPRCDSTNTKFCYYNNYNLNQPRYLCKACKRYWTKGGTRRNVPVGGGSRKNNNKIKSKLSSSSTKSSDIGSGGTLGLLLSTPHENIHPYRFMPPNNFISSPLMETNNFNQVDQPWRFQTSSSFNGLRHSIVSPWAMTTTSTQSTSGTRSLETVLPLQVQGNDHEGFLHQMKLSMPINHHDHQEEVNLSRQVLMIQGNHDHNNHQYNNTNWGNGNAENQL